MAEPELTKARGKSLRAFQGMLKKTKIQGRVLILSGPGARRAARDDMRSGNAAGDRGTQQRARGANQPARAGGLAAPQRAGRGGQSRFARGAGWEEASGTGEGASVSGRVPPEAGSTRKDKTIVWEPLP